MKTTAGVFLAHCDAGLTLTGCDEFGTPEWVGTPTQWNAYQTIIDSHV